LGVLKSSGGDVGTTSGGPKSSGNILDEKSISIDSSPVNLDSEEMGIIIMRDGVNNFFINKPIRLNNKYIGPFIGRYLNSFDMRG